MCPTSSPSGSSDVAVSYIVRSATGLPVASFDSLERARAFRDDRAARGVRVTLHESRTVERPIDA